MSLHATLTLPRARLAHGVERRVFFCCGHGLRLSAQLSLYSAGAPSGMPISRSVLGHGGHGLAHLVAADRADAADAEGLDLRQLAGVEDEAALLGRRRRSA